MGLSELESIKMQFAGQIWAHWPHDSQVCKNFFSGSAPGGRNQLSGRERVGLGLDSAIFARFWGVGSSGLMNWVAREAIALPADSA